MSSGQTPSNSGTRRPIQPHEQPHLEALGQLLRSTRQRTGLTQAALARAAQLSIKQVRRLEQGQRRTRQSTLRRIAEALATDPVELGTLAGPALAPESPYADRIARRRARRHQP